MYENIILQLSKAVNSVEEVEASSFDQKSNKNAFILKLMGTKVCLQQATLEVYFQITRGS